MWVFDAGVPVLGICYGLQTMSVQLGGKVQGSSKREYGHATVEIKAEGLYAVQFHPEVLLAPTLIGWFIDTPATIAYGAAFLRIMVLAMPMMAVCYPMITQFQAMGRVKESLICSVLRNLQ